MKKSLKFVAGVLAGFGIGIALCTLKRQTERTIALMTSVDPDICKGFEAKGLQCISTGGATCFLLKGKDGYLLIDTGYARGWDTFCANLDQAGIAMDEIKALLITHSHYDHIGFAAQLLSRSDAQLIIHRSALSMLSGDADGFNDMQPLNIGVVIQMALLVPTVFSEIKAAPLPLDDAILIDNDSDILRDMGFDADILVTPGHSHDSLTVLTGDKRAFVGDLLMSVPLVKDMHLRPILHTGLATVFASWRKVLQAGTQTIYPTHGAPVTRETLKAALTLLTGE